MTNNSYRILAVERVHTRVYWIKLISRKAIETHRSASRIRCTRVDTVIYENHK